jgi:DNA processing protein
MNTMEEKYSLCALNRIFGFDPKAGHSLVSHLGSASEAFRLSEKEMNLLIGPYSKYKGMINRRALDSAAEELERLSSWNISFIGHTEEEYPQLLLDCEDAPLGLYVRSSSPVNQIFPQERRIAIVGTRDISPYGQEWCNRIVDALARTSDRPGIVSGLALGTDICAHRQAVRSGLPTIAVMATGPETVYPHRHREFAEEMVHTPGCALITDYPPGTAPLAVHFLRRNRIIAGLSDATILIESRIKGGGMMTSRLAFSYNREVYALPGRIDDPRSQGCNLLIKEKIAEAIDSVEGLLSGMGMNAVKSVREISDKDMIASYFSGNGTDSSTMMELTVVFGMIRKNRGINLDDLSAKTGFSYSRIARLAGMLEMEDLISMDLLQRCTFNMRKSR